MTPCITLLNLKVCPNCRFLQNTRFNNIQYLLDNSNEFYLTSFVTNFFFLGVNHNLLLQP